MCFTLPALDSGAAETTEYVLPPGAESIVRKAFDGQTLAGWRYDGAEIRSDRVALAFFKKGKAGDKIWTEAMLVHGDSDPPTSVTGKAPAPLQRAVAARLAKAGAKLPWLEVTPGPAPAVIEKPTEVEGERTEDDGDAVVVLGEQIEHLIARGDKDLARERLLGAKEPSAQSEAARVDWAVLHLLVGETAKAKAIAESLNQTRLEPVARVLLEEPIDAKAILASREPGERCSLTQAGRILRRLGRFEEAKEILSALVKDEESCLRAVIELALVHVHFQDGVKTLQVIEAGLVRTPDEHELLMMKVSALRLQGRHEDAIRTMESIVRSDHRQAGNLGMLLAMYLRGQDTERAVEEWKVWHEKDPEDVVAPFMVGVLLHYGNAFEESDRWLEPLENRLHDEPRIYVYRAMNAFNLGDLATARKYLDAAALLPVVDPDVYYCRAEITRDTERELAIEDLGRYLALTNGTPHASVAKQARVQEMYDELLVCHRENHERCAGPWEHPRKAWWATPKGVGLLALSAMLMVGLVIGARRRRRGAVAP